MQVRMHAADLLDYSAVAAVSAIKDPSERRAVIGCGPQRAAAALLRTFGASVADT